MKTQRPNILYIFTDQQSADAMSCANNPYVHTPAMDQLAARGVRFERTYSTYPLCTPARASMFTGRMPHEMGIDGNDQPIPDSMRMQGIGYHLSAAGYECVYGGKWHVPEIAIPKGHGFRSICGFDDNALAQRCAEFLTGEHEKPFFLVASFDNPHNICEWGRQQVLPWGPIPETPRLDDLPNLPANFCSTPFEPVALHLAQQSGRIYGITRDYTPEDWRRYRYGYYRLIEKVDREIGKILDVLQKTGLDENTLVIFSSDHGDMAGAHRMIQKSVLYDESARIPFIIKAPGGAAGRVDATHLVSNGLDLYPTLCDYAGIAPPEGLEGYSLRPLIAGADNGCWRDHLVSETRFPEINCNGRMVRTDRYKYIIYELGRYREQLFDMAADPAEQVNLAMESRFRDVLEEHRDMLSQWCERTGDRFGHHYAHKDVPYILPGYDPQTA